MRMSMPPARSMTVATAVETELGTVTSSSTNSTPGIAAACAGLRLVPKTVKPFDWKALATALPIPDEAPETSTTCDLDAISLLDKPIGTLRDTAGLHRLRGDPATLSRYDPRPMALRPAVGPGSPAPMARRTYLHLLLRLGAQSMFEKCFVCSRHTSQAWETNGSATSALLHCCRRNGQPDRSGAAKAAYLPAFAQPTDPGLGASGRGRAAFAQRPRRRTHRGGHGVSRQRPAGTDARGSGRRDGTPGGAASDKDIFLRLSNRTRDDLAAAGNAVTARRAAAHPGHDL